MVLGSQQRPQITLCIHRGPWHKGLYGLYGIESVRRVLLHFRELIYKALGPDRVLQGF